MSLQYVRSFHQCHYITELLRMMETIQGDKNDNVFFNLEIFDVFILCWNNK